MSFLLPCIANLIRDMRAHTKSAIRLPPEKPEGSAMSASQRFDRFLRIIERSKILQRALLNSKKSICDPCKILSAPFKSAPAQQQERGAGGMCAYDYIIRIIGWKWFWRDLGFFSLPGSRQVLSVR